jgi:hypothetical protein
MSLPTLEKVSNCVPCQSPLSEPFLSHESFRMKEGGLFLFAPLSLHACEGDSVFEVKTSLLLDAL